MTQHLDDLVLGLRGATNKPPQPDDYLDQLLGDAADEIERLRAFRNKIGHLLEYLPGVNDERDSTPILLEIKRAYEQNPPATGKEG